MKKIKNGLEEIEKKLMVKIKRKEYRKFIRILIFFLERNIIF
jgi:hypothetical protein